MADRLVVDLGGDGRAGVLWMPDGGLAEEVSRAPLAWPLDGEALAGLIVAIATLAWTIYSDQRKRTSGPEPGSIERQVRITLREQDTILPPGAERITEVVVSEIIRQARPAE